MKDNEYNKAYMYVTGIKVVGDIVEFYNEAMSKDEPIMYGNKRNILDYIKTNSSDTETDVEKEYSKPNDTSIKDLSIKDLKEKLVNTLLEDEIQTEEDEEDVTDIDDVINTLLRRVDELERITGDLSKVNIELKAKMSTMLINDELPQYIKQYARQSVNPISFMNTYRNPMEPGMHSTNGSYRDDETFNPYGRFMNGHDFQNGKTGYPNGFGTELDESIIIAKRIGEINGRLSSLSSSYQQRIMVNVDNHNKIFAKRELEQIANQTIYNVDSLIKYGTKPSLRNLDEVDKLLNRFENALKAYDELW